MVTSVLIYTCDGVLREFLELLKGVRPPVVFDGECRMALEHMQGTRASFQDDLGYKELFSIAVVTSVFL